MNAIKLRRAAHLLQTTESHVVQHLDGTPFRGKYLIERVGRDENGWSLVTISDLWGRPVQIDEPETTCAEEALRMIAAGQVEDAQRFAAHACRRMNQPPF